MQPTTASQHSKLNAKRSDTDRDRICRIAVPAAVLVGSFVLYWSTAARYPGWVDATLILNLVRKPELGVWVNIHNLFNLIGYAWLKVFSAADPHFALTILCSLFGSLTVLFIYKTGVELTKNVLASALAAIALTVSLSLWWHSTTIEVYTLNTTLLALFLFLVFRAYRNSNPRYLYLAFFSGGLGVSNHVLMGLYIFAFLAVLLPYAVRNFRLKAGSIVGLVALYLAGTSLFATLFILHWSAVYRTMASGAEEGALQLAAKSLAASLRYATGGYFLKSMFTGGMTVGQKLFWRGNYLFLILLNYPSAAIIFIVTGFPRFWRHSAFRGAIVFFLVGIAAQIIWSANYFIWDMYAFALPVYVMLAVPLVTGIDGFLAKHKVPSFRWLIFLTFLVPVILYPSFSHWPNREKSVDRYIAMYPESERTGGLWDPAEYIFNPIKRNYDAVARYCEGVLNSLPEGANFWDDESKAAYPLSYYYQAVKGRRRDVKVNRVFGLVMEESDARYHAQRMLGQLRRGERVFVSALVEPEKEILVQLYHLLEPGILPERIRSMDLHEFRSSFPEYEIIDVPLGSDKAYQIYQLRPRNSGNWAAAKRA
jgi:hypothetical protein